MQTNITKRTGFILYSPERGYMYYWKSQGHCGSSRTHVEWLQDAKEASLFYSFTELDRETRGLVNAVNAKYVTATITRTVEFDI